MELRAINRTWALIPMEGEISLDSEVDLKTEVTEAKREYLENILLDFRPLDHIDNEGITSIVKLVVLSRRLGIQLYSFGISDRYRQLFDLTGLSTCITPYRNGLSPETDEALTTETVTGKQDDRGWTPHMEKIVLSEKPAGALKLNMNHRKVLGPLQGFGPLWQKVYTLDIDLPDLSPADIITTMKQHFPEFQPDFNRFYPTSKGITAGEPVFIDSTTPGGVVSTGVLVLYADETGFSLMTPAGHPEAGWVSFNASQKNGHIEMKIRGIASASDPVYELAFRVAGSKFQEEIWVHVLESLAGHIGVPKNVVKTKVIIDNNLHWSNSINVWYNAQIRSFPWNITLLTNRK